MPSFAIPDQPTIEGLSFRRYAGSDDLPRLWTVMHAQATANEDLDDLPPLAAFAGLFAHPIGWTPEAHVLIAEVDGAVVAWSRIQHQPMTEEDVFRSRGYVLPVCQRRGLGRAMLAQGESDLLAMAAGVATTKPRSFQGWTTDRMAGAKALFDAAGYVPFHTYFEMNRPAKVPLVPALDRPGVAVEIPNAHDLPEFLRTLNAAFADHWGNWTWSDAEVAERVSAFFDDPGFDARLLRVVRRDGRIVGTIELTIDPDAETGSVETLATLAAHRGAGIGSSLLRAGLMELMERGVADIALQVDAEDRAGALGLYQRFGFSVVNLGIGYRKAIAG